MKRLLACIALVACGDNQVPGDDLALVVSPDDGLRTSETGEVATFTVALATAPSGPIAITVTSLDTGEGTVSPATILLDATNFATPVTVTVTGIDDELDDGDQPFEVSLVAQTTSATVAVTNADDDGVGVNVDAIGSMMTTEDGGTAAFSVVLGAEPTADVVIALESDTPTEGTVEPKQLTFTPANWNAPQIAIVTGIDDDVADGTHPYTIQVQPAVSADPEYNGLDPDDVAVLNVDNDSPGVIVTPTTGLVTNEGGGTATFSVVLTSQPSADVTIGVASSDPSEGNADVTSLVFTTANWDAPHVVTVTGANDGTDDGDQSYTITLAPATSSDGGYAGLNPDDVAVTNLDDENPGVIVSPASGLTTSEGGLADAFTVRLLSPPTADVTITLVSSDPGEGTANPSTLTFTPADFDTPQTVRVVGANDDIADGNQPYRIILQPVTSADPQYAGIDPPDVALTNLDDDSPGIRVSPTNGLLVSELGDTATFTIVLLSEPLAPVTIGISSNDTGEGTVAPSSVTFNATNWDIPRTITITGRDDSIADGNQLFGVLTAPAVSADPGYNGLNAVNVSVTNFDDDTATIIVNAPAILQVQESGGTASFTMVLTQQPTANVNCAVSSSDLSEGTVSPSPVVFTPGNFDVEHVVTVTGVDDAIVDGTQLFTIVTAACQSADPAYDNVNPQNLNARNLDDD